MALQWASDFAWFDGALESCMVFKAMKSLVRPSDGSFAEAFEASK